MKTYFVVCDDEDGESLDLMVVADIETDAIMYWRSYYELEDGTLPERMFILEPRETPGPMEWDGEGLRAVYP